MKKILSLLLWIFVAGLWFFQVNIVDAKDVGINFKDKCLVWMWRHCFHYEKIIWIDEDQPDYTAVSIAQDVIFAATYILWAVLTIVMIYCWLMYIFAARWGKDTSAYKKWLQNALIWSILVRWAYAIVRLIQYVAQW